MDLMDCARRNKKAPRISAGALVRYTDAHPSKRMLSLMRMRSLCCVYNHVFSYSQAVSAILFATFFIIVRA